MSNAALSLQTKKLYPNQFGCNFFLLLYITNGHFHNSYWSIYCNSKLGTTPLYDKLKMTENKSVEKSFEDSGDFFPPCSDLHVFMTFKPHANNGFTLANVSVY